MFHYYIPVATYLTDLTAAPAMMEFLASAVAVQAENAAAFAAVLHFVVVAAAAAAAVEEVEVVVGIAAADAVTLAESEYESAGQQSLAT